MIVKKPSIFIYSNLGNAAMIKEICAGIEEEGVFFEVFSKGDTDVAALAYQAAADSMMGSGIGICKDKVVLQMKGLPKEKPVFSFVDPSLTDCRNLGANSARAMKKMAFK